MSSILSIGASALSVYQQALSVTSDNIANASTEGYTRRTVSASTSGEGLYANTYQVSGVQVQSIERAYDEYLSAQVYSDTSLNGYYSVLSEYASEISDVLSDSETGLTSALDEFYQSLQDLVSDPTSSSTRQALLSEAESLASTFNQIDAWLDEINDNITAQLQSGVQRVNELAADIAELNAAIASYNASDTEPLDLLDQRDLLIEELSQYVSVTTLTQDSGAVDLYFANGQALVIGDDSMELEVVNNSLDPDTQEINLIGANGVSTEITSQIGNGELGGLLTVQSGALQDAINELGVAAIALATEINDLQEQGLDLNGEYGLAMFTEAQPSVTAAAGNTGTISVSIGDTSELTGNDYTLNYDGSNWLLVDSDGNSVTMTGAGTAANPLQAEGLSIVIGTAAAAGDTYYIRPTANAASEMEVLLYDTDEVAAAAPVVSAADTSNSGSGTISQPVVTDIDNAAFQTSVGSLTPPIAIVFVTDTTYNVVDMTNPSSPVVLEAGITYDPTDENSIFPTPGGLDYGYTVTISGAVDAGDSFTVDFNSSGTGDARNATLMAELQSEALISGDTLTEYYAQTLANLAGTASRAESSATSAEALLEQSVSQRDSLSGVNLDEEAASLVQYQQAYQAAAQVIAVAEEMFDTLLAVVSS